MTAKDFLQFELVPAIEKIAVDYPFFAFELIASGIEVLGRAINSATPWNEEFVSGDRFKEAIDNLFPPEYQTYKDLLYKEFRCGFAHISIPNSTIYLMREGNHEQKNGKLYLSLNQFIEDYKKACDTIANDKKYRQKLSQEFYEITEIGDGDDALTGSTIDKLPKKQGLKLHKI